MRDGRVAVGVLLAVAVPRVGHTQDALATTVCSGSRCTDGSYTIERRGNDYVGSWMSVGDPDNRSDLPCRVLCSFDFATPPGSESLIYCGEGDIRLLAVAGANGLPIAMMSDSAFSGGTPQSATLLDIVRDDLPEIVMIRQLHDSSRDGADGYAMSVLKWRDRELVEVFSNGLVEDYPVWAGGGGFGDVEGGAVVHTYSISLQYAVPSTVQSAHELPDAAEIVVDERVTGRPGRPRASTTRYRWNRVSFRFEAAPATRASRRRR